MSSHGYGGTDRVEGRGEQKRCLCGWTTPWGDVEQVALSYWRHLLSTQYPFPDDPSMEELLNRARLSGEKGT